MAEFSIDRDVLRFLNAHLGTTDDEAFEKCSYFAYRDMCRTISFKSEYKELAKQKGEGNEEKKQRLIQNKKAAAKKLSLRKKVEGLIKMQVILWQENPPKSRECFDCIHNKLCNDIITVYKSTTAQNETNDSLFYGQAQKWVNMTLKNLYVYSKSNDTALNIEPLLPFLHVPIDSIIISVASGKTRCAIDHPEVIYGVEAPAESWSQMDEKAYEDYQGKLRKRIEALFPDVYPIIWELRHWSAAETYKEK